MLSAVNAAIADRSLRMASGLSGKAAEPFVEARVSNSFFGNLMPQRIPVVIGGEFHRPSVFGNVVDEPWLQV